MVAFFQKMSSKNKLVICLCISLVLIVNPISWVLFFDFDGHLGFSNIIFLLILDSVIIAFILVIFQTRNLYVTIKIFLFNLLLLFIGSIIFDLIFGDWLRKNTIRNLWIPSNTTYKIDLKNLYKNETKYIITKIDQYGFRGDYNSVADIDILTVGGSTTKQDYVGDGYTWQDIISKNFEGYNKQISVVNAGIDGQSTFGHINNFHDWFPLIPNLRPKYILFYIGINDFYINAFDDYDNFDLNKRQTNFFENFKRKSIFAKIHRTYRGNYLANAYGLNHDLNYSLDTSSWTSKPLLKPIDYNKLMTSDLISYEGRLKTLSILAEEIGAVPIFVTQTTRRFYFDGITIKGEKSADILHKTIDDGLKYNYNGVQYNGVDFYYMLNMINRTTMRFAKNNNYIAIDLAKELTKEFDIFEDYYDAVHNTPSGAKKIGDYLFQRLKYLFLES